MKKILADRMKYIDSSGIRKVFALAAQMKDPINFSIGQPDFDTPEMIKQQAIQEGMRTLTKAAIDDMFAGNTTINELMRVVDLRVD